MVFSVTFSTTGLFNRAATKIKDKCNSNFVNHSQAPALLNSKYQFQFFLIFTVSFRMWISTVKGSFYILISKCSNFYCNSNASLLICEHLQLISVLGSPLRQVVFIHGYQWLPQHQYVDFYYNFVLRVLTFSISSTQAELSVNVMWEKLISSSSY